MRRSSDESDDSDDSDEIGDADEMEEFFDHVGQLLGVAVAGAVPVAGGDTAKAFRVSLVNGDVVFAKTYLGPPRPTFFDTEAVGLRWLRESGVLQVPEILAVADRTGAADPPPVLVLEWVERAGPRSAPDEWLFGAQLAQSHLSLGQPPLPVGWAQPAFGRPDERPTGSLMLPNTVRTDWAEFYATNRLAPLCSIAADRGALPRSTLDEVHTIMGRLDSFGAAEEPPALLHGDLWAGNRLVGVGGRSWLIDPAAHGGHREYDLAMMQLFGGFGSECFQAYHQHFPLSDGWAERVPLHQLAPLMVHAIKFGGGYVHATERAAHQVLRL